MPQPREPTPAQQSAAAWHTLDAEAVGRLLHADLDTGLSPPEAAGRLAAHGPNAIRERGGRSLAAMVLAQFSDFMILVLIAAAAVSGVIGDLKDTIVIVAIVVLNAVIGVVQDYRAEKAMAALKQLAALKATVLRAGRRHEIAATEIVRGDVVLIEAGSAVPADLRLYEAPQLKISEAVLTGEPMPVDKRTETLSDAGLTLADQTNMAFKGTVVTYGRGRGVAVATGMTSELGKIAGMLESAESPQTPLQRRLAGFGRQLAIGILGICAVVFVFGVMRGEPALLMLLTALSLAVAAIPEALPAVVTVMLALGGRTMARRNALIRRLPAVETLGSVTFICSDKTGTLTLNQMRVRDVFLAGARRPAEALDPESPPARRLLEALALSNDAGPGGEGDGEAVIGDPTEVALWRCAAEAGFDKAALEKSAPRRMELPFDSERKRMTTFHVEGDGFVAYTKGAPEAMLDRCEAMLTEAGEVAADRDALAAEAEKMAGNGLRVLAVACRRWDALPQQSEAERIERELTFLGLVGLIDPPRPEARRAVARCRSAGIAPVMITGDHPVTARAIARDLDIIGDDDAVMSGRELAQLPDDELARRVAETAVYARVDPAQKIRIVEALQRRGQFVAMTGDGVNDAPALSRADIGVAMGRIGTDVAREAASLVLLDDNFATIVAAVEEGRRIYDNIRKFIRYTLSSNSAEILTIFLAPFFGLPVPLLPIHILWINLLTDGLPGLALATEPPEAAVMARPPRPPNENIFARGLGRHIVWVGILMAGATLSTQAYSLHLGLAHWQTMVFTVLTLSQVAQVLAIRSDERSLFQQGLMSNRPMVGAVVITVALQLMTIYVPTFNVIFDTAPLTLPELAFCLAMSSTSFIAVEIAKWLARRGLIRH